MIVDHSIADCGLRIEDLEDQGYKDQVVAN
jgi:hypothetical protein